MSTENIWGYLFQDKIWRSADGRVTELKKLEPRHRRNLIAWLQRRAPQLKMAYEWSLACGPQPSGEMAADAFEAEQSELWDMAPAEWLNSTPLMAKLLKIEDKYNSPKQLRRRQRERDEAAARAYGQRARAHEQAKYAHLDRDWDNGMTEANEL